MVVAGGGDNLGRGPFPLQGVDTAKAGTDEVDDGGVVGAPGLGGDIEVGLVLGQTVAGLAQRRFPVDRRLLCREVDPDEDVEVLLQRVGLHLRLVEAAGQLELTTGEIHARAGHGHVGGRHRGPHLLDLHAVLFRLSHAALFASLSWPV